MSGPRSIRLALLAAALAMACGTAHAQAPRPGAAAEIARLSAEVDKLEGARAVRKLQRAYGYYIDRGLWDEAADLFADDGTVEIGMDGVYAGKARIREYLQRLGGGKPGLSYGQGHGQLRRYRQQGRCRGHPRLPDRPGQRGLGPQA